MITKRERMPDHAAYPDAYRGRIEAIITIYAMGTQKAIAEQIIEGGADYVLALKGNQGALHQAVIEYVAEELEGDLIDAQEHVTTEKGHGREETRTYLQPAAPEELPGFL